MKTWEDIEKQADLRGFIPETVYNDNVCDFTTCPPKDETISALEAEIWRKYLSTKKRNTKLNMYSEMYRYEWYEGRRRTGFWGNIEDAVSRLRLGNRPGITIFSSGSGRDLLKVGLAAGVWKSVAPDHIRGSYKEIDARLFRLQKPETRFMVTEYDGNNIAALKTTIKQLMQLRILKKEMVAVRKWDFRRPSPVAAATQDLAIFSLTGNYATLDEQPRILGEVVKCIKPGGCLVASTMTSEFRFKKVMSLRNKIKIFLTTPLAWPVAIRFFLWQSRWAKMAARMNEKGYWNNVPARTWADFLKPHSMETQKIYAAPSNIVPVEVLVSRKIRQGPSV